MKKSLFDKIIVGFVFLVLLIFSALIFVTINTTKRQIMTETSTRLEYECSLMAEHSVAPYVTGSIDSTQFYSQLNNAAAFIGASIWYIDQDNHILTTQGTLECKLNSQDISSYLDNKYLKQKFTLNGDFSGCFNTTVLSVGVPVYIDDVYSGMLIIHSPISYVDEISSHILSSSYMPFVVLVFLALVALMIISNSVLKPMNEIIATSKQYANGNFNARVNVNTNNEFGELARYMEEMADELSRSNEYRKSFISNISHDFRSPLTSIKGYIQAMLDGTIPLEKHEKYLTIVLNESQRLTKLTQGLLELNNFDSFDLQLDKSNFDIKSIITPTINTFEGRCQDKGIYLHSIFLTDNTMVYADRTKIQQVIYNLVDNAIKFTPEGRSITVQVTEKNDKIYTSVKDEGVGIPKESLKKVFDRFYKTDPSRGKDKTGTGLGLAITKEIIKAHGEHITLTSEMGEGSEFIFSLPKQKDMVVPIKPVHIKKEHHEPSTADTQSSENHSKFKIKQN